MKDNLKTKHAENVETAHTSWQEAAKRADNIDSILWLLDHDSTQGRLVNPVEGYRWAMRRVIGMLTDEEVGSILKALTPPLSQD